MVRPLHFRPDKPTKPRKESMKLHIEKSSPRYGLKNVYGVRVRNYRFGKYPICEINLLAKPTSFGEKYLVYCPTKPVGYMFYHANTLAEAEGIARKICKEYIARF